MKIVQAILIAAFIIIIPFLLYIWMLGAPIQVGYKSLYVYTAILFLIIFFPLRKLVEEKKLSLISYFIALGKDLTFLGRAGFRFVMDLISILWGLLKSISSGSGKIQK